MRALGPYRLGLMNAGQPCLLWLSGRDRPGVHAVGELCGPPDESADGPVALVRFTLLAEPVDRAELLADPAARDAEVLRMPAGSNPSWLSELQFAAVLAAGARRARHRCAWDDEPVTVNRLRWGALAWLLTLQFFVVEAIAQSRYVGAYPRADDTISALGAERLGRAPADERLVHPCRRC